MTHRNIIGILKAEDVIDDGDMHLRRALPQEERVSVGPFVFVDHYRHRSRRGIGDRPHPHAGIEVVSYLLEGGVAHRDSMGHRDRLGPGDAQHIRAGRGMLHAEQPEGGRHGLQLWLSLPPEMKQVEPSYASLRARDLPTIAGDGARMVVVAGAVNGVRGPMDLSGGAIFAVAHLDPGAQMSMSSDAREAGLYVLSGVAIVNGTKLNPGTLCVLGTGSEFDAKASAEGAGVEVALIGGDPVRGAVLFSGPFVMDTPERLHQAREDFRAGKMGRLEGVPF